MVFIIFNILSWTLYKDLERGLWLILFLWSIFKGAAKIFGLKICQKSSKGPMHDVKAIFDFLHNFAILTQEYVTKN